jgi:predicted deacylase
MNNSIERILPEIEEIYRISNRYKDIIQIHELDSVESNNIKYPILALTIGSSDKSHPTLGLFGGVHGLERIGTHVILSYLYTLEKRLEWDQDFVEELKTRRVVCIPIVNPWGMAHLRRSNINGIDLMRNAPIDAENKATFLVGGHRYSKRLPWYRGEMGLPMEKESQTLIDFVSNQMFQAKTSIALDIHSGFGTKDQLWYPYAKSKTDFPYLAQFKQLSTLFSSTFPHHIYKIEPQAGVYMTHGDLWDYSLEIQQRSPFSENTFIPLTLELGSWNWVRKNPLQLFNIFGLYNPVKKHRYSRTMRRHIFLLDFLLRAVKNDTKWNINQ